ncbi:MAG: ATP phosphoribosyltransferase [Candidatus Poribacteria bacterium]|nr:MAG: ATP phosphoribosyltransferase [Candidatus Poribacteria bacterium]
MSTLKIGIPKGSLQDATVRLFEHAGYPIYISSRSYTLTFDDEELEGMLLRPQEMALYVERGHLDIGIAGKDWVVETGADVLTIAELHYNRASRRPARWVLAVPEDSPIRSIQDVDGKVIYTELVRTTEQWLAEHGVKADVRFSHGVTEAKVPYLCDAIVDLTETGSSLRANRLRIVAEMIQSYPVIVANKEAWTNSWKRSKIEDIVMLLQGALAADSKVGLKMNVPESCLEAVLAQLPAMKRPTISPLTNGGSDERWFAVETIVDQSQVRDLIPKLRRAGASDFIEYPLNKVIP